MLHETNVCSAFFHHTIIKVSAINPVLLLDTLHYDLCIGSRICPGHSASLSCTASKENKHRFSLSLELITIFLTSVSGETPKSCVQSASNLCCEGLNVQLEIDIKK